MKNKIDKQQLQAFMGRQSMATKVYIGCDSDRFKHNGVWMADYALAIVIHIDGHKGCKIFGELHRERDYDQKVDRPFNRMMAEAMKAAELYLEMREILQDFDVQVHLDINPDPNHGSSVAAQAAAGYVKGVCNIDPLLKPQAFAASYAADRLKELADLRVCA